MKQQPAHDPFEPPPAKRIKMVGLIIKRKGIIVTRQLFPTPNSFWGFYGPH